MVGVYKGFFAVIFLLLVYLTGKFFLPFLFPFLLGLGLAAASEPAVRLGTDRLKLGRGLSAGLGVTATLVLLLGVVFFLGAVTVRELGVFARQLPGMARQSADLLEGALVALSHRAPDPVGTAMTNSIHRFFQDNEALADRAVQQVPGLLSGVLDKVPGSAMSLGTGVLSGYFISSRLPGLKTWAKNHTPPFWTEQVLPVLRHLKSSLGKWLVAQGKLMGITYCIVAAGLWLLGIPSRVGWAILVAAVDAIPLLGTGTVLLPWALTRLLQGDPLIAAGMTALYLVAMVTRTVLEPRFYGQHLGLDPLVMLIFLYAGYRLWGCLGIIISPLLAATTKALTEKPSP